MRAPETVPWPATAAAVLRSNEDVLTRSAPGRRCLRWSSRTVEQDREEPHRAGSRRAAGLRLHLGDDEGVLRGGEVQCFAEGGDAGVVGEPQVAKLGEGGFCHDWSGPCPGAEDSSHVRVVRQHEDLITGSPYVDLHAVCARLECSPDRLHGVLRVLRAAERAPMTDDAHAPTLAAADGRRMTLTRGVGGPFVNPATTSYTDPGGRMRLSSGAVARPGLGTAPASLPVSGRRGGRQEAAGAWHDTVAHGLAGGHPPISRMPVKDLPGTPSRDTGSGAEAQTAGSAVASRPRPAGRLSS